MANKDASLSALVDNHLQSLRVRVYPNKFRHQHVVLQLGGRPEQAPQAIVLGCQSGHLFSLGPQQQHLLLLPNKLLTHITAAGKNFLRAFDAAAGVVGDINNGRDQDSEG